GRRYASPVGISPTGLSGLWRPQADSMQAAALPEPHSITTKSRPPSRKGRRPLQLAGCPGNPLLKRSREHELVIHPIHGHHIFRAETAFQNKPRHRVLDVL